MTQEVRQDIVNLFVDMDNLALDIACKYGLDSSEFNAINKIQVDFTLHVMTTAEFCDALMATAKRQGIDIKLD